MKIKVRIWLMICIKCVYLVIDFIIIRFRIQ
jgi:hypothetical protein